MKVVLTYRQKWRRRPTMETINGARAVVVDFMRRDIKIDGKGLAVDDVEPRSIVILEDENE